MAKQKKLLTTRQRNAFLKRHDAWTLNKAETVLSRSVAISNYIDGLVIIARTCVHAEMLGHHPDITYSYGKVVFKLTTHDVKGLTKLDTDLAERIERILKP